CRRHRLWQTTLRRAEAVGCLNAARLPAQAVWPPWSQRGGQETLSQLLHVSFLSVTGRRKRASADLPCGNSCCFFNVNDFDV
ncbi:hypothetical protein BHE74_00016945, partial [Ensete ventricosum]